MPDCAAFGIPDGSKQWGRRPDMLLAAPAAKESWRGKQNGELKETMGIELNENRPGGTIDSWCGKCKLMLAHTIEAMVGNKPARVHCNTCQSQHAYKASEPGRTTGRAQTGKPRQSRYKVLLNDSNSAEAARSYSPKETYQPGDVLKHPSFGLGVTTAVKDGTKIEVLFEGGVKLLIQGQ
jgi:hypothetical protein